MNLSADRSGLIPSDLSLERRLVGCLLIEPHGSERMSSQPQMRGVGQSIQSDNSCSPTGQLVQSDRTDTPNLESAVSVTEDRRVVQCVWSNVRGMRSTRNGRSRAAFGPVDDLAEDVEADEFAPGLDQPVIDWTRPA